MNNQIAETKILDANGTYFINSSILPVFLNEDGDTYIIEEYEVGEPCSHTIKDLIHDGVMFVVHPIGFNKTSDGTGVMSEPTPEEMTVRPYITRCMAGRDGECCDCRCPQLRDDEPAKTGRHCPLDKGDDDD